MDKKPARSILNTCLLIAAFIAFVPVANAQSPSDCAARASRAEGNSGSVLGGATRGAVRGGAFGAIVGDSDSARKGAQFGAVVGGIRRSQNRTNSYNNTYDNCMRGRY